MRKALAIEGRFLIHRNTCKIWPQEANLVETNKSEHCKVAKCDKMRGYTFAHSFSVSLKWDFRFLWNVSVSDENEDEDTFAAYPRQCCGPASPPLHRLG